MSVAEPQLLRGLAGLCDCHSGRGYEGDDAVCRASEDTDRLENVLAFVALGKVAVAGAGLGLAALGVVDVAGALGVKPLVNELTHNHALDIFAYGGGIVAVVARLAWRVVTT